jgi:hypothetical protein
MGIIITFLKIGDTSIYLCDELINKYVYSKKLFWFTLILVPSGLLN